MILTGNKKEDKLRISGERVNIYFECYDETGKTKVFKMNKKKLQEIIK